MPVVIFSDVIAIVEKQRVDLATDQHNFIANKYNSNQIRALNVKQVNRSMLFGQLNDQDQEPGYI
jgi:hypothetical protein